MSWLIGIIVLSLTGAFLYALLAMNKARRAAVEMAERAVSAESKVRALEFRGKHLFEETVALRKFVEARDEEIDSLRAIIVEFDERRVP